MTIHQLHNFCTEAELTEIRKIVNNTKDVSSDRALGRLIINLELPYEIQYKFAKLIDDIYEIKLSLSHIGCVEYSNKYGEPNLPPHFDGSTSDLIIAFQLEANTYWDLGINTDVYYLKNNSIIIFNPNENIHWRPHKIFNDEEYVKMIFIRFDKLENPSDYSHKGYSENHPIFAEAFKVRDSLGYN